MEPVYCVKSMKGSEPLFIGMAFNGSFVPLFGSVFGCQTPAGREVGLTRPADSIPRVKPIPIGCSEAKGFVLLLLITLENGVDSAV